MTSGSALCYASRATGVSGKATHAFLGVSSKDEVAADGPAKRAVAVITNVSGETPADKAG